MSKKDHDIFSTLKKEVIDSGICTHCGTCIGLCPDQLKWQETKKGPVPKARQRGHIGNAFLTQVCPALSIKYNKLNHYLFGQNRSNYLLGNYQAGHVGFATDKKVRMHGASGGITTAVLLFLLKQKLVDGAVVIKPGQPKPWLAEPTIATTAQDIMACSQSVYAPVMTNTILPAVKKFNGNLAYVGLPDQIASIRMLQQLGHKGALKIKYLIGLYTGTSIYFESIVSFLRSHGIKSIKDIVRLRYRDGEWPGHLRIDLKDGRSLQSPKFYYNYLIPFYITQSSLLSVDFTNELADISVGDAWNPKLEKAGGGFSVLLARTKKGSKIIDLMVKKKSIKVKPVSEKELIKMHSHMIEFKKRGAFIRLKFRKILAKKVPFYDYCPVDIPLSRYFIELFISTVFFVGKIRPVQRLVEKVPPSLMGRVFELARSSWKKISKPGKRKGLTKIQFKEIAC